MVYARRKQLYLHVQKGEYAYDNMPVYVTCGFANADTDTHEICRAVISPIKHMRCEGKGLLP